MSVTHLNDLEHVRKTVRHFWSFVEKSDGCWLWSGSGPTLSVSGRKRGYFQVKTMREGYANIPAARFAYIVHNECIPKGKVIAHTCDNPLCVRPDHLEAATYQKNIVDALERIIWKDQRRHNRERADEIREYYAQVRSYRLCALRFDVPRTTVVRIIKREHPYSESTEAHPSPGRRAR